MSEDNKVYPNGYEIATSTGFGQVIVQQREGNEDAGTIALAGLIGYRTPEFRNDQPYPTLFCADADSRQAGNPLTNPIHATWHFTETRISPEQLSAIETDIRDLGALSPDRSIPEKAALDLHTRYCRGPIS